MIAWAVTGKKIRTRKRPYGARPVIVKTRGRIRFVRKMPDAGTAAPSNRYWIWSFRLPDAVFNRPSSMRNPTRKAMMAYTVKSKDSGPYVTVISKTP
jgi:hypothetical protein